MFYCIMIVSIKKIIFVCVIRKTLMDLSIQHEHQHHNLYRPKKCPLKKKTQPLPSQQAETRYRRTSFFILRLSVTERSLITQPLSDPFLVCCYRCKKKSGNRCKTSEQVQIQLQRIRMLIKICYNANFAMASCFINNTENCVSHRVTHYVIVFPFFSF